MLVSGFLAPGLRSRYNTIRRQLENGRLISIGVMSGIIGANNRFGQDFNYPDADMQGNITALYDIGCVVGSIITYFVGERLGRRTLLIMGGSIMIVGTAILASSFSVAQLIVGRIVTGIGNGMNSSTAPVYQSELSPAANRGMLLTFQGTVTILGVVIAFVRTPPFLLRCCSLIIVARLWYLFHG